MARDGSADDSSNKQPETRCVEQGRLSLPDQVWNVEWQYIHKRRHAHQEVPPAEEVTQALAAQPLVGLAMSGGGIRSATFGLGVLQALAKHRVLPAIDYLCTVSGGGYIGSCLSSLMSAPPPRSQREKAANQEKRAYDLTDNMPLRKTHQVHHLRKHGDFLIARRGLFRMEVLRAIGMLLTGIVCSLALYLILMTALSAIFILYACLLSETDMFDELAKRLKVQQTLQSEKKQPESANNLTTALSSLSAHANRVAREISPQPELSAIAAGAGAVLSIVLVCCLLCWPKKLWPRTIGGRSGEAAVERQTRGQLQLYGTIIFAAAIAFPVALCQLSNVSLTGAYTKLPLHGLTLPLMFCLGATSGAGVIYTFVCARRRSTWKMRKRGLLGAAIGIGVYGVVVSLVFVSMFGLTWYFLAAPGNVYVIIGGLVGAASTRWLSGQKKHVDDTGWWIEVKEKARSAALSLAVFVVLAATALLCTKWLIQIHVDDALIAAIAAVLALILFLLLGFSIDFNRISPHYFYRDRLAEAYLVTETHVDGVLKIVRRDYSLKLKDLHAYHRDGAAVAAGQRFHNVAPYHLLLCAVNLAGSRDLARKDRKSDHFIFSREYCGSTTTGYVPTRIYRGGETKLCTAMTISGAAVSSGMGFYTSFAQAFAVTLFNIRLGYWLVNPCVYDDVEENGESICVYPSKTQRRKYWSQEEPQRAMLAQHFRDWLEQVVFWPKYLLFEMTAATDANNALINLSDGGHTGDDIGLYPLLQRRCRLIIASDGEDDPEYNFASLAAAIRQIFIDENVVVHVDVSDVRGVRAEKGQRAKAKQHFVIGRIDYPESPLNDENARDGANSGANDTHSDPRRQASFGWLVYLKSSLVDGHEPAAVTSYAATHADFPHETTGDQFFDDDQFEAYRALGYHIASETAGHVEQSGDIGDNVDVTAQQIISWCQTQWKPPREMAADAYRSCRKDLQKTADKLGIERAHLQKVLEEYKIHTPAPAQ